MAFDRSKLGFRVRDLVSGFEGIATGLHHYNTGCTRVSISQQTLNKDGELREAHIFDEGQVEILGDRPNTVASHMNVGTPQASLGGPTDSRSEV